MVEEQVHFKPTPLQRHTITLPQTQKRGFQNLRVGRETLQPQLQAADEGRG